MSSRDKQDEHAGCWRCFKTASESRVEAEISWAENPTSGVVPGCPLHPTLMTAIRGTEAQLNSRVKLVGLDDPSRTCL
jgi:hypothetical protein